MLYLGGPNSQPAQVIFVGEYIGEPYTGLVQAQNHFSPGKQYSATSFPLAMHQSGTAGFTHASSWALPIGPRT